ncbi:MAG: xylulokinase [Chloroflexi bacterium]|nr:xylulokinase [Chloroflexota bacterium]
MQTTPSGVVLGIDVGTTGTRAIVVDPRGRILGGATAEYPLHTPRPLWAEQDPADWWRATIEAVHGALSAAGLRGDVVQGIGLSGQMHGTVFLDAQHAVIRPAILWCDQRTQRECDWITERVGAARLIELTCNPALTGFSAPKIVWLRDHEPGAYVRVRKVLLPKDYIRFLLTGEFATEVSDASGTLLLDVARRAWSAEMLERLAIDPAWLPEVYESPVVSGRVTPKAAEATGLAPGTPVVGGGGDQAAGGIGNGIVRPGVISSTIGTSGVVFAFAERPNRDRLGRVHTFCHAVPGRWHVMGVTQGAGLSLRWLRDNFGAPEQTVGRWIGHDPYELLTAEATPVEPGSEGLIFLPYLMGERTPHLDANARGVLFGLTARHDRRHVIRAVLEGVAFSLRDSLEILHEMGIAVEQVRFSGGGARSRLWRQIQADVFGRSGVTLTATEGPAFGAALLAAVGTGVFTSVETACDATLQIASEIRPVPSAQAAYAQLYPIYRDLYPALKPQFDRLTAAMG